MYETNVDICFIHGDTHLTVVPELITIIKVGLSANMIGINKYVSTPLTLHLLSTSIYQLCPRPPSPVHT